MARGGMARVFLATLRGAGGFEKRLVVKQIRPELASDEQFVRRFVDEAKTAVSLSHPNIVPVYELGVEQGTYYIAMELCEGVTLADLLRHGSVLSAAEGAYLGVEVCRALDYAHRRSVVHRDVTPRNVMVDAEGAVRLIDFGIAGSVAHNQTGLQVFGSLGHMAPEHLAGEAVGPAADVFAVGTVLIEAWTGKPPFRRDTLELTQAALEAGPGRLSDSNPQLCPLDELLVSAVDLEVERRPASAEELARPLREFLKSVDVGDVARELGFGVRELLQARVPFTAARPDDDVPVNERTAGGQTRTFAAQPAFEVMTQPLHKPEESRTGEVTEVMPSVAASEAPGRPRWLLSLLLVVLAASIAVLAVLTAQTGAEPGAGASHTARATAASVVVSATRAAPPAQMDEAPAVVVVPAPSPASATSASVQHGAAPTAHAPAGRPERSPQAALGYLTLSSEPPCEVRMDGAPRGKTPLVSLKVPIGTHSVQFVNEAMGERLSTSIDLAEGQHRRLHADFTAATPRLSSQ